MDEELYAHVMKRTAECKFHDKGSKFIQALIREDMKSPIIEAIGKSTKPDKKVAGDTVPGKEQAGFNGPSNRLQPARAKRERQKPSQN